MNEDHTATTDDSTTDISTLAVTSTYKILGEFEASDGSAILGQNNAGSGTPLGVQGTVPNADGYGLATPDDARIGGTVATTGSHRVTVGGNRTLRMDAQTSDDAGNIVAGHTENTVKDSAIGAVIGGGGAAGLEPNTTRGNIVTDDYGVIGGGLDNVAGSDADDDNTSARYATVGGGRDHEASAPNTTVGGGVFNEASGKDATVGGGNGNNATAQSTTVGGGYLNTATTESATVGGGERNDVKNRASTIGGGLYNLVEGKYATIAGGGPTDTSNPTTTNNVVYDNYGTVGGGGNNQAGSDDGDPQTPTNAPYATVSGGRQNVASDYYATVGGGYRNDAKSAYGIISGGWDNEITDTYAAIAGGRKNEVSGRDGAIGGGRDNDAAGVGATVPGGHYNTASGADSFAAGENARAENVHSFVWNDGSGESDADGSKTDQFSSSTSAGSSPTGSETFHVKSTDGVRFVTSADNSNVTYISGGSAGWSNTSTRTAKTNIDPVDTREALAGVRQMEIATWEYKDGDGEGRGERHMGPMAEEFHDAFDVGNSDDVINSINADGVLFAALQGLCEKVEKKDERIDDLEERLAAVEARVGTTPAPADDCIGRRND